ncbi:MAG: nitrilase-related carbon-nitrogen hydrolase [Gemmataceae bacterium]
MSKLPLGVPAREGFAAVGIGLLGAAAFPPIGFYFCGMIAPVLLLLLLRKQNTQIARNLALVFGITYAISTMYWMWVLFGPQAIPLWGLMAGYFGLFGTLVGVCRDYRPWLRAALVALFAVGLEWLRGDAWYLRFPWYTPPHALAQQPVWIAPAHWLGVYGFSFVIWLVAGLGAFRHMTLWTFFLLFPLASFLLPAVDSPNRTALLIQAESEVDIKDLIAATTTTAVDLAIFPELAFLRSPSQALASPYGPVLLARKTHSPVVFGAADGDYHGMKFLNLAAVIDESGKLLGTFQKQRPVPLMGDGEPGTERPVFSVGQDVLGVAICYDFDGPAVANSLVSSGATVLVVPTLDAIWWTRVQHAHHELLLRIRAVENDRWVLRAASSGRSEVIDPHGVASAKGVEIGDVGSITLPFAHRSSFALGGKLSPLGPVFCAGTLGFAMLSLITMWRQRLGRQIQKLHVSGSSTRT